MNGKHDIDARCRRDDRWRRRRLVDDSWRRCWFINDRRRRRLIHDRGRRWRNDDRWGCRSIDNRWRTLTLIGVMLAPFAALVLAPLMFAPFAAVAAPTIIIGAGRVRAHSA
jgi:hypothetical protein